MGVLSCTPRVSGEYTVRFPSPWPLIPLYSPQLGAKESLFVPSRLSRVNPPDFGFSNNPLINKLDHNGRQSAHIQDFVGGGVCFTYVYFFSFFQSRGTEPTYVYLSWDDTHPVTVLCYSG